MLLSYGCQSGPEFKTKAEGRKALKEVVMASAKAGRMYFGQAVIVKNSPDNYVIQARRCRGSALWASHYLVEA